MFNENQIDKLEELGWTVYIYEDCDYIEIGQYTPLGEDWFETLYKDDFDKEIREIAIYFDVDEECMRWAGDDSVPGGLQDLLADQYWKKGKLEELAYGTEYAKDSFEQWELLS